MSVFLRPNDHQPGTGLEITIRLTPQEAEILGEDAELMVEILDSHLWAMGMLRAQTNSRDSGTPPPQPGDWMTALMGSQRLLDRLRAVRTAVIRAHAERGGSSRRLADALGISQSAARRRTTRITSTPLNGWEKWATQPSRPVRRRLPPPPHGGAKTPSSADP